MDSDSENSAAPSSSGAGGDVQKKPLVRLLNSVRKSEIETCAAQRQGLSRARAPVLEARYPRV